MNDYVKNKWVYGLLGLAVIGIVIWIIAGTYDSGSGNETVVNQETYTMESTTASAEENSTEAAEGYFIIRAENGTVRVFWVDETGEYLHRETSIAFDLLSAEDQALLESGVKIESEEELAGFLENYDS